MAAPSAEGTGGSDNSQAGHTVDEIVFPPGVEPKFPSNSIWASDGPVDRADFNLREEYWQDQISAAFGETIRAVQRAEKKLRGEKEAHEKERLALQQELDDLMKKEKGQDRASKEKHESKNTAVAQEQQSEDADMRQPTREQLRKQKRAEASLRAGRLDKSAKFVSDNLSEKLLGLTVEVLLARAEVALILGRWTVMEEHGRYASELAAQLKFQPLSARCDFYKGVAYRTHGGGNSATLPG